jgi:glutathione S-transferase
MDAFKNLVSSSQVTTSSDSPIFLDIDGAPSWSTLENLASEMSEELGIPLPKDEDMENGPPNPMSLRRLFGTTEEPRVKLYRDHAAWCPYCHKVVLQLEEKRIPYVIEKINMRCYGPKPRAFIEKVPSGLLPVLEVDGQIITESSIIQRMLEEMYPDPPLMPPKSSTELERAMGLMQLERQLFGDWLNYLCRGANKQRFVDTLDIVDSQLGASNGPYFLSEFSLVDIVFAPFLERIVASMPYYKGLFVRGKGRWANLEDWFNAMETRPAYMAFKSDFYTHCHDLPPQLGGCISTKEGRPIEAAIDGVDGKSWSLPLDRITGNSLEPLSTGDNPSHDRFIAASRLINNHGPVVRFALRGVGNPGQPQVMAPLSDPYAKSNMDHEREVDAALRYVAHLLLTGSVEDGSHKDSGISTAKGNVAAGAVVPCLCYLRDRIGVPRDMPYPAARQFRAHLNWMIDHVTETENR